MTLLIKHVRILGGGESNRSSGASAVPPSGGSGPDVAAATDTRDVFVSNDKISAIGNFSDKKADEVLDGQGGWLSPGFIDVDTESDHYLTLFDHPGQEDFLRQGVTTIFGGLGGSSLAPLLYGTLESVRKWSGSEDNANVNWHSMGEFLAAIDRRPLAVNFGTLAGHGTMRRAITGEVIRELTRNELSVLEALLRRSLGEGGFGLSTNLGSIHAQKTSAAEMRSLAQIVRESNGVYAANPRYPAKGVHESVAEVIKLAKDVGVRTLINHLVPIRGAADDYRRALALIDGLPPALDFHFDVYPFPSQLLPFYLFLPEWVRAGGFEVMYANLREDWLREKIKKDMPPIDEGRFTVAQAPGNEFLIGKSLDDLKAMYGVSDGRNALLNLMTATKMRGIALYENLDPALVSLAITHPRSFIASNAPSFGDSPRITQLKSERTTRTFIRFLEIAEREGMLPLETAIRKLTSEPARKFGLTGRGEIKEGNYADLVCFKNAEIKFTIVNGKVVVKDGEFRNVFPGKTLRHHG